MTIVFTNSLFHALPIFLHFLPISTCWTMFSLLFIPLNLIKRSFLLTIWKCSCLFEFIWSKSLPFCRWTPTKSVDRLHVWRSPKARQNIRFSFVFSWNFPSAAASGNFLKISGPSLHSVDRKAFESHALLSLFDKDRKKRNKSPKKYCTLSF